MPIHHLQRFCNALLMVMIRIKSCKIKAHKRNKNKRDLTWVANKIIPFDIHWWLCLPKHSTSLNIIIAIFRYNTQFVSPMPTGVLYTILDYVLGTIQSATQGNNYKYVEEGGGRKRERKRKILTFLELM